MSDDQAIPDENPADAHPSTRDTPPSVDPTPLNDLGHVEHLIRDYVEESLRVVVRQSIVRTGPLPSPDELKEYEKICPGFTDRILTTYEKEMEHRHSIENRVEDREDLLVQNDKWAHRYGQIFGLVVTLVFGWGHRSDRHPLRTRLGWCDVGWHRAIGDCHRLPHRPLDQFRSIGRWRRRSEC
ncbi:hypothetical protein Pan216_43100 [Planctomycetes bacterium Pan216]|uniref:DUF2335 domain-containing protein n=1 Tax=Kolteria novifilia TaxID=2527975 RepID=A0A518B8Y1_9BACT|nr:hypothetical protein Pan216_43100 [Planctomycetes bacterium Pan216]